MNNLLDISVKLNKFTDREDPFRTGHQILTVNRPRKKIPAWAANDARIKEILLRAFPKMKKKPKQRVLAGKWIRVINLYFRQRWTRGQIAEEMGLTYSAVDSIIRNIKRVSEGLSSRTGKPRKRNKAPV